MLRLSPEEKAEIRRLAATGMPSRQIGRVMGRADRTVGDYIDRMKQRPPRVRTRASVQLTLAEREEISRGLAEGHSIRSIASRMARSPSTVCREITRNGGRRRYRAVRAEDRFAGAVLSAPMLGVLTGAVPRPLARALAGATSALGLGGRPVPGPDIASTPFEANIVTHDRERYERNEGQFAACPDLALGLPTWGWLRFAFTATDRLARGPGVPQVNIPVVVLAAGEESLVDNVAVRAVTARLPNGRYVEVPGARHEILQETDTTQATFWAEFDDLADRLAPAT